MAIRPEERESHERLKAECIALYGPGFMEGEFKLWDPSAADHVHRSVAHAAPSAPVARDPLSYTSAELVELRRTDPERCSALLAARQKARAPRGPDLIFFR